MAYLPSLGLDQNDVFILTLILFDGFAPKEGGERILQELGHVRAKNCWEWKQSKLKTALRIFIALSNGLFQKKYGLKIRKDDA